MSLPFESHQTLLVTPKFSVGRLSTESSGMSVSHEFIVHPGVAAVLPVLTDGRLLLIRNHRVLIDKELWEIPAGTLERDESPESCARRELAEETGYVAHSMALLGTFYSSPGISTELVHLYVATELSPGPPRLQPDELITVHLMARTVVFEMIANGTIQDSKTLAAFALWQGHEPHAH